MANRQQRRAQKHKGKRPGETYMDVLTKKKLIKEAIDESVKDNSISIEADIKTQRLLWMSVIALNEHFGFGKDRGREFLLAVEEVANEFEAMRKKHDHDYAVAKLMERAGKIMEMEMSIVHEDEMREARAENEANGIFFRDCREV